MNKIILFLITILSAQSAYGQFGFGETKVHDGNSICWYEDVANGLNKNCLKSPSSLSDDTNFTWPDGDGASGQALVTDGSGGLDWGNAGGGSGKVNYIDESDKAWDFEANITGWSIYKDTPGTTPVDGTGGSGTAIVSIARNTTTPLKGNADLKITKPASNIQGEGASVDVDVPKGYRNGRQGEITLLWDGSNMGAAGDWVVYVYDIDNTTLITPHNPELPKITDNITIAWDSVTDTTQYRLIFHAATTSTSGYDLYVDDVIFGPGSVIKGFAGWKQYSEADGDFTVTGTNWTTTAAVAMPYKTLSGTWRLKFNIVGTLSSSGISNFTATISGVTFKNVSGYNQAIAVAVNRGGSTAWGLALANTGQIQADFNDTSVNGIRFSGDVELDSQPTWAEDVTVNLGANDVEYASNSDTGVTTDTSSFAHGPEGQQLPSGAASSGFIKRVRFNSPIQSTDAIEVQLQPAANAPWVSVAVTNNDLGVGPLHYQSSNAYGIGWKRVSGSDTDIDVQFGKYAYTTSATYGGSGTDWSSVSSSTTRWRVVKHKAGVAVGFSHATADTYGLVKKNKWQRKELSSNQTSDGTMSDLTFTLEAGKTYKIHVSSYITNADADSVSIIEMDDGGTKFDELRLGSSGTSGTISATVSTTVIHEMANSSLTFDAASLSSSTINASGLTYVTVEECNNCEETSDW